MSRTQPSAATRILLTLVLLAPCAFAVSKSRPNLSGVWKLDRDLTTAPYVKDDTLVVHQTKQRVKFVYQTDGKVTGTDLFITDGKEMDRYKTRIERAFYRATWKADRLVIVTQHVLDLFGYQSYKETDSWTLDAEGKTLTQHLSDGKVAVYYYKGAAPDEPSEETKEFRAVGIYSVTPTADSLPRGHCSFDLSGTMKNDMLGPTTYRLCLRPDTESGATAAPARCDDLRGTMDVTAEDGFSTFVLKISGRYCPKDEDFIGNYEVDSDRITGTFNPRLTGGSGILQFSRSTDSLILYGVLVYD